MQESDVLTRLMGYKLTPPAIGQSRFKILIKKMSLLNGKWPAFPLSFTLTRPYLSRIRYLEVGGREALISLYADDIILYLRNSERSVPILLDLITSFGALSGYKINWSKSTFMPLSETFRPGFFGEYSV